MQLNCYDVLKDLISLLLTVYGLYIASEGLKTWRKQLRGNDQYEYAKKIILLLYEIKEAIRTLRLPIDGSFSANKNIFTVLEQRKLILNEKIAQLNSKLFELKTIFKIDLSNDFEDLLKLSNKITDSINLYACIFMEARSTPPEELSELSEYIFYKSEKDELLTHLSDAIGKAEIPITSILQTV